MSLVGRIIRLTPSDALALNARARSGDTVAVRDFIFYGLWRKIKFSHSIPKNTKVKMFSALVNSTDIEVEVHGK